MLKANVRHARDFEGDLSAQIGSVLLAERRVQALAREFDRATIADAVARVLDATEAQARANIAGWKDGTYAAAALLHDAGRGNDDIAIRPTVTVSEIGSESGRERECAYG